MKWEWPDWFDYQTIILCECLVRRMTLTEIDKTKDNNYKPTLMRYKVYTLLEKKEK